MTEKNVTIDFHNREGNEIFRISKEPNKSMIEFGQIFKDNDYTVSIDQEAMKVLLPYFQEFADTGKISYKEGP